MSAKLNQNHPDCTRYKEKYDAIWAEMNEELAKVGYASSGGLDGGRRSPIYKKYMHKIALLKQKYAYLYTDEGGAE